MSGSEPRHSRGIYAAILGLILFLSKHYERIGFTRASDVLSTIDLPTFPTSKKLPCLADLTFEGAKELLDEVDLENSFVIVPQKRRNYRS